MINIESDIKLNDSNQYVIDLIKSNKPFIISRLASESYPAFLFMLSKNLTYPVFVSNNAGIYSNNPNEIALFYNLYFTSAMSSDGLAIFNIKSIDIGQQEQIMINLKNQGKLLNLRFLTYKVLEPFYCLLENIIPWSHYLLGKKILIISPFIESFTEQLKNGFKMFKGEDKHIFLPGQEFIFYKCFSTLAGNHLHSSWLDTFNIMCNDILKLDFDIALLSCGGYGLPLCGFIKNKMNKSAIYIGGGLQLLFGVIGKRWDTSDIIQEIIKNNDCKFIRPSDDETVPNVKNVEGGCYW